MANEFRITGLENALSNMRNLAPRLVKKGLGEAARAGMAIVRRDAVARAKGP